MNETKSITRFTSGLISNPDAQDVADDSYVAGTNIDPDGDGVLKGIPIPVQKSINADARSFQQGDFLKRADGKYDLIYHEGNDICSIEDFYGTPAYSSPADFPVSGVTGTSFVPHNQEVYIASTIPRWVGRTDFEQFGVNTYDGVLSIENAEIPRPGNSAGEFYISGVTGSAGTPNVFSLGSTYTYALSCVYDGIQESPISSVTVDFDPNYTDYTGAVVTIKCNAGYSNLAGVNRRITAVKLYRKETKFSIEYSGEYYKVGTTAESVSSYELLQVIKVADDAGVGYDSTSWSVNGNDYQITYTDINDKLEGTFYEESGMPETLESFNVKYNLNASGNGFMFVADCTVDGTGTTLPDASHMVFRSRENRYSMFDWTTDYIKLNTVPTALVFFNSRLYAFDSNDMYMINPDTLEIEDILPGAGCISQKSITSSNQGLFWANKYNVYQFDGNTTRVVSERIKTDWQTSAANFTPVVLYDSIKNVILIHTGEDAYYYHLGKRRWDFSQNFCDYLSAGTFTGGFSGKFGETYSSNGALMQVNFTGTTTRNFSYTSKTFLFGTPGQKKEYYWLTIDSNAAVTTTYSINGGSSFKALTGDEFVSVVGPPKVYEKQNTMKIKIVGIAAREVYNYEMIFRRMRGARA